MRPVRVAFSAALPVVAVAAFVGLAGGACLGGSDEEAAPSASSGSPGSSGSSGLPSKKPGDGAGEDDTPTDPTGAIDATPCTGSPGELYALTAKTLATRVDFPLCRLRGSVLLIVNVASFCGYTPQYAGLQALFAKYASRGFYVLGFPSQSFNQESSDEAEVEQLCKETYKVKFPMFAVGNVAPPDEQPVYTWLKAQPGVGGDIPWNFEKFLISRKGVAVKRFIYTTDPDPAVDPTIENAILEELAK